MEIERQIDIGDTVRQELSAKLNAYCRPLPKNFALPCILVTEVGGGETNKIDTFDVVIDSRAETDAEANLYLRNAIGILKAAPLTSPIRWVEVNTLGNWGEDPVRPELAMFSARLRIVAHIEKVTI